LVLGVCLGPAAAALLLVAVHRTREFSKALVLLPVFIVPVLGWFEFGLCAARGAA